MITGILFDKDGTLFDFEASWTGWASGVLLDLADGDPEKAIHLGQWIGFDFAAGRFEPDSVAIAGTLDETTSALLQGLPHMTHDALITVLRTSGATAQMVEAVPLAPYLADLRTRGVRLGVATNDSEVLARSHLAAFDVDTSFDYIAGADSGFGAKPGPGMCLGFSDQFDLAPETVLMVGDSRHDLMAAQAAGMIGVGVLTGMAGADDLSDLAQVVLPDIGHVPGWLDATYGPDTPGHRQNTTRSVAI
ncbi:HAD-IA family hydrolase [Roseobacter sp. HKCCD9010]|uniref:HAD family hydrolase n=1 Tax=unclassified Roseobacter TaxID=196798 RepID=UPI001492433A|nr:MULTISPECIES: HAD family hydrolase [unclassified Roseobacter]MBF9051401.1 HAD-IA family hydrolase [Rhodobacterales bacterium HKCCD4356]NNV13448.1 HAD-IA family hydrolase [Roseobacter sp. HKCCD7357]NNV17699.1 HAD-IA family hydrolase [Roseobacter sp. HKCCD8768]NNV27305.1 HAD-IA family hydrolase [Roseobacter sp. HKCCD8192]NNV31425.1 HAD-IA family hydrolase [Roseobacter sp. HKCCD9061]